MLTVGVSSIMSPANKTRIAQKNKQIKNGTEETKLIKDNSLSSNAAAALKAQVLYQKSKDSIDYLEDNLSKKEIISALKDKNKMGRSFFGFKSTVANIITKAEDTKLATKNFNILMNFEDGKLNANDITDILMVATSINNKKMDEKLMSEYGFNGGNLDNKTIDSILNKIKEQRELQQFAMMQQQMMQQQMMQQQKINDQMLQQMMQQQMINDQILQQHTMAHQQAMQQQMMMTTPGMGFC